MMTAENPMPAFCVVKGYVTPNVVIKLGLPTPWNGKFMEVGCGGTCGIVDNAFSEDGGCEAALRKGYACIASDAGHTGAWIDGLWGYENLEAKLDWGYRAPHVSALGGNEYFYGRSPRESYFVGGSNGGRQALQEAQRFPSDFDGIVALAPAADITTIFLTFAWGSRVTHDAEGKPLLSGTELKLLTDAAVAKCDLDDGVKDNVINDPFHCSFDPSQLACQAGHTSACLTPIQVSAVKKVYAGPMSSTGASLSLGGPLVGSEFGNAVDGGWRDSYVGYDGKAAVYESLATAGFRYLMFLPDLGPRWKLRNFDFDRDSNRLQAMAAIYNATNPDLRKFKAAGGKLLILQGLNDNAVLPRGTIDYYESMERTMGGAVATRSFARLFLLPGVGHGGGGDVGAGTLELTSLLGDRLSSSCSTRVIAFSAASSFPPVLRGLTGLPLQVRESEHEPIRIFLQDGANDSSFPEWGTGAERNRDLVSALKDKGYDYRYAFGEGTHGGAHAASVFPEAMRWLWWDYPR